LIADDQTIMRDAYSHSLEETTNITIVASVADGQTAVAEALRLKPDVVLLDIQMPKLNGIEAARQIRAELPQVGVVLISNYHDRQYAETFLRDGTAGKAYMLKTNRTAPNE